MVFEVKLLEHLRRAGYPVPRVISTRWGDAFFSLGGTRHGPYVLVTEWIPGRPYESGNPAHLREAGRALARYHQAVGDFSARFRPEGRPVLAALEWNGPSVLATFAGIADPILDAGGRQRLTRACSYLWSQFLRVPEALAGVQATLPQLVIQASFGRSALIYDGDAVAGVVDYDRAGYDLRALDLVYAVNAFARVEDPDSHHAHGGLDVELCAGLMAAYAELEPLAPAELEALPLVFRAWRLEKVMSTTMKFLRRHEVHGARGGAVEKIVDVAETEADRLRWLEEQELALHGALSGSLAGPRKG
jgi:homoserine kinase type II